MLNNKYNYKITTEEINSPKDKQSKFVARVGLITELANSKFTFYQPRLGEVYGETQEEATEAMEERISHWIKKT